MFILIVVMHVNLFDVGTANSLLAAEFKSRETCEKAGQATKALARANLKQLDYTCQEK